MKFIPCEIFIGIVQGLVIYAVVFYPDNIIFSIYTVTEAGPVEAQGQAPLLHGCIPKE